MAFRVQKEGLFLWCLLSILYSASYAEREIKVSQGVLQGTTITSHRGRNIFAFLAIPYAQPPIGPLRFAKPVPAGKWDGILNATEDANRCPQNWHNELAGDEDCLYLNVYVPQLTNENISSLLAVMVYVHGGGFQEGSGLSDMYGPQYILDEDVILVTVNYRLGLLGFLSTGDEVSPGNWGLKDQVLALKWVRDNIKNFGGDPHQVTPFGESAGGALVHLLSLSRSTVGLFQKYITQSGSALAPWAYVSRNASTIQAFELGKYVGCSSNTSDALISCLRTRDLSTILDAYLNYTSAEWKPTIEPDIDGAFLTDTPAHLYATGQMRDIPWLTGLVRDEGIVETGAAYRNEETARSIIQTIDSVLASYLDVSYDTEVGNAMVNAVKSFYFNDDFTKSLRVLIDELSQFVTDVYFYSPALNGIRQHVAVVKSPQYLYALDYQGIFSYSFLYTGLLGDYGVAHADDLIYLFPCFDLANARNKSVSETNDEMIQSMVQLWTSFAINGTPTASALNGVSWDAYSGETENYLRIGNNSDPSLKIEYSLRAKQMEFLASLADIMTDGPNTDNSVAGVSPNLLFILLIGCFRFISSRFNYL